MSLYAKTKAYIDYLYSENEPPERQPSVTHIPVRNLGLPKIVVVRHT